MRWGRVVGVAVALVVFSAGAFGQSKHLAPGFEHLPKEAKVVLMPPDIALFSLSAGGVLEPKADWTEAAVRHFRAALLERQRKLGLGTIELSEDQADELAEVNALHAAVAQAIELHHFGPLALPTKEGRLDWSLAEAVRPVKEATGADFALFSRVRDSYASGGRKAMMVAGLLILGPRHYSGPGGGRQMGYASLVDLNSGQVLWFNSMMRRTGDLREPDKAADSVEALLAQFPVVK
jgi:hypothetical protein